MRRSPKSPRSPVENLNRRFSEVMSASLSPVMGTPRRNLNPLFDQVQSRKKVNVYYNLPLKNEEPVVSNIKINEDVLPFVIGRGRSKMIQRTTGPVLRSGSLQYPSSRSIIRRKRRSMERSLTTRNSNIVNNEVKKGTKRKKSSSSGKKGPPQKKQRTKDGRKRKSKRKSKKRN